jgi:hypothetical protein
VRFADGSVGSSAGFFPAASIQISSYRDYERFHVLKLGDLFDVVLGRSWLKRLGPDIDWDQDTVRFSHGGRPHCLRAAPAEPLPTDVLNSIVSAKTMRKLVRSGAQVHLARHQLHGERPGATARTRHHGSRGLCSLLHGSP